MLQSHETPTLPTFPTNDLPMAPGSTHHRQATVWNRRETQGPNGPQLVESQHPGKEIIPHPEGMHKYTYTKGQTGSETLN